LVIPNQDGFFDKDIDASSTSRKAGRARIRKISAAHIPSRLLLFYLNHLGWELKGAEQPFAPAA